MSKKVGLSLSFCVKDMVQMGHGIDTVGLIVAGTKCRTVEEFYTVLDQYQQVYWRAFPQQARELALSMWWAGMIRQPKLDGKEPPNHCSGLWRKPTFAEFSEHMLQGDEFRQCCDRAEDWGITVYAATMGYEDENEGEIALHDGVIRWLLHPETGEVDLESLHFQPECIYFTEAHRE